MGDGSDSARAQRDVLQSPPALFELGGGPLAQGACAAQEPVVSTIVAVQRAENVRVGAQRGVTPIPAPT